MSTIKIASYNVNGIRAALNKNWIEWLEHSQVDIIGIQETKAQEDQVDLSILKEMGFEYQYWHSAEKKGYSGVAVFSKLKPDHVVLGIDHAAFDQEGRVIRLDFGSTSLLNCYFPSGTSGDIRQQVKYEFLDYFYDYIQSLRKTRPNLIIQGDYNIAHSEMDIHNPKGNKNSSGFLPEERAWMSKWLENGMVDTFRYFNPDTEKYTWWSYRAGARKNNKGWRIDYQAVTEGLIKKVSAATIDNDAVHSDHCPCLLEIDLD